MFGSSDHEGSAKSRDPLSTEINFSSGKPDEDRLRAFFCNVGAASALLACVDGSASLSKRDGVGENIRSESRKMLREAEAKLRDYNLKHRSALQAALLINIS